MKISHATALTIAMLALARPAAAETFRYVDREGRSHEVAVARHDGGDPQTPGPAGPSAASADAPAPLPEAGDFPYASAVREAAALYSLPAELILAVMTVESGFDSRAVSPAGAMGLMQLMPATAAEVRVTDLFDPRENVMGGARYLRILVNGAGGDVTRALSSYHAGAGATQRHGGVPPFPETHKYVGTVLRYYQLYLARGPAYASITAEAIRNKKPSLPEPARAVASPKAPVVASPPRAHEKARARIKKKKRQRSG